MAFSGFPTETLLFLSQLELNNYKGWFDENRERYERYVLEMSRSFVEAMEEPLIELDPSIVADPRTNKSMFRINRDTRFNPDAEPYKTNIACVFWNERGKRMEAPCFYFHLEPDQLFLGAGIYKFSGPVLKKYRAAVAGEAGEELVDIIDSAEASGYGLRARDRYVRVPRGYDAAHPRAELLKFKGLTFMLDQRPPPQVVHEAELVDHVTGHFEQMYPLYRWMSEQLFN